jgi:DNA helicase II / ATP-dependent DNA helicase PcrA
MELLLAMVNDLATGDSGLTVGRVLADLTQRDADELAGSTSGVNLLTYHRAKGLEWDAVFLPSLEEGLLPIRQAKQDDAIAEERRLLCVGITRARDHLWLSWAQRRSGLGGKESRRQQSRFLAALEPKTMSKPRVRSALGAHLSGWRPPQRSATFSNTCSCGDEIGPRRMASPLTWSLMMPR